MLVVADNTSMDQYITGVTAKANHHAMNVLGIVPMLRHMAETFGSTIELPRRNGPNKYGNESWFYSRRTGKRYHFGYIHDPSQIELRRGGRGGSLVATFDNDTAAVKLFSVFDNL